MDEDQPIKLDISLCFQIEDVKMQYAAMEKYMEDIKVLGQIKTELGHLLL